MVSSISRNYISGISSGMDTDSLISQMLEAASSKKYSLERKRNKVSYQQSMLQEVNLKLYNLQTKATDLTFSKTYTSKTVESTDSKVINATATTAAKAGTYNVKVKQLATSTNVTSKAKLAGSLELGNNISSNGKMGGSNTTLGALGIDPSGLKITTTSASGQVKDFNIATSVDENSTVDDLVKNINNSIKGNAELNGKITASYDEKNNTVKFTMLDSKMSAKIQDAGAADANGMIAKMFGQGAGGSIELTKDVPAKSSTMTMRTGAATTLKDLNFTKGTIDITRNGRTQNIDLRGLDENMTVGDLVNYLNDQIDQSDALSKTGRASGNPKDRAVEFRYDESSGQLRLLNTNTGDTTALSMSDANGGTFVKNIFGKGTDTTVDATFDGGVTLANETFGTGITAGTFTVDGVQISIDPSVDTLQGVLSRITSMTNINATYDSETDKISFTRKDGSTAAIGIGASNDTSNFLNITGMMAGSQAAEAHLEGQNTSSLKNALGNNMSVSEFRNASAANVTSSVWGGERREGGTITVNVNGVEHNINYTADETYQDVLDKISEIDGIESAYYDASTGKVNVIGTDKGNDASISISDKSGSLASKLGIDTTAYGSDRGSTLTANKTLSDVKTSSPLAQAGFANPVTAGTFTINGVQFTINNTQSQTMDSIIDAINNNEKVGVTAQYNPTTGEFVLTSKNTGNQTIAIGAAGDTSNFLSSMGLTDAVQNIGQNCIYSIDSLYGGEDQVSQSNTISDAIEGMTLSFREVTQGAGEAITVKVDTESAKTAIKEFIDLYNEITEDIYTKLTEKSNKELEGLTDSEKDALGEDDLKTYEDAYKVGLLRGDSTLRNIRSQLRTILSSVVSGADSEYNSLAKIGITTGAVGSNYTATMVGKLSITDEDALDAALQNDPEAVAKLFNNDSDKVGAQGIARRLKDTLNSFTKSDGLLTSRIGRSDVTTNSQMDKQIAALNEQINAQKIKLAAKEESLISKFSRMESALSAYQSQSESLANSLSSLLGK